MLIFLVLLRIGLDAGVLDEEEVGLVVAVLAAGGVACPEVVPTRAEFHVEAVLTDCLGEEFVNFLVIWLAAAVLVVVGAGVDGASRLFMVDAVVEYLTNCAVWAGNGDVPETHGDVAALHLRVAKVADHRGGVTGIDVALVGSARFECLDSRDHQKGEEEEGPDH